MDPTLHPHVIALADDVSKAEIVPAGIVGTTGPACLAGITDPSCLAVPVPADRHPAAVYIARLAPGSRPAMRSALDIIADIVVPGANAETFAWHALDYQHAQAIRAKLAEEYAIRTANRMLSALRGVVQEAWRLGLVDAEKCARIRDVPNVTGTSTPAGRALASDEVARLLAACDPSTPRGARDAALVAVLFGGGLRRAEAVAIDLDDIDGNRLRVEGKGRKVRTVALPPMTVAAISAWLAMRGRAPGPLLVPVAKRDTVSALGDPETTARRNAACCGTSRLSASSVRDLMVEIGSRAGVARFTPHDARRTRLTGLIDAGVDLAQVQRFAGHNDVATTLIYDRRADEARHAATAAVDLVSAPAMGKQ